MNFLASPDIRAFSRQFIHDAVSSWPRTFFTPKVFLFILYTYSFHVVSNVNKLQLLGTT